MNHGSCPSCTWFARWYAFWLEFSCAKEIIYLTNMALLYSSKLASPSSFPLSWLKLSLMARRTWMSSRSSGHHWTSFNSCKKIRSGSNPSICQTMKTNKLSVYRITYTHIWCQIDRCLYFFGKNWYVVCPFWLVSNRPANTHMWQSTITTYKTMLHAMLY